MYREQTMFPPHVYVKMCNQFQRGPIFVNLGLRNGQSGRRENTASPNGRSLPFKSDMRNQKGELIADIPATNSLQ